MTTSAANTTQISVASKSPTSQQHLLQQQQYSQQPLVPPSVYHNGQHIQNGHYQHQQQIDEQNYQYGYNDPNAPGELSGSYYSEDESSEDDSPRENRVLTFADEHGKNLCDVSLLISS